MANDNFWSWAVWVPILVTLVSGTVSSLANKVIYDTPIEGTCGVNKFQKAYWFTLCMFLGEAGCLAIYYCKQFLNRRRESGANSYIALSGGSRVSPQLSAVNQLAPQGGYVADSASPPPAPAAEGKKPPIWVYAVLCCFDLSATSVGGVGLIWVDASTNQMLRGSMVVFCALFSVLMLTRKLTSQQWSAIGVVCVGLVLVGMSGMLKKHFSSDDAGDSGNVSGGQLLIGILLVLLASALNALQNVYEEHLLKAVGGAEVDPLELVGWEGVFGSILAAFVLLPIVQQIPGDDCGKAEDSLNTLKQLQNSGMAVGLSIAFAVSLLLMNWTSQQISQQLSAVHRNLVSAVRTVLVWVGSLILFYATRNDTTVYGEKWTNWSLLELAGFLVLVVGTVLYSYFGLQVAKLQALEEAQHKALAGSSPDYVLPIESGLAEHTQVIKQQTKQANRNGAANGHHANGNGYASNVYEEDA